MAGSVSAQETPHTSTLPGISGAPFSYAGPSEVGIAEEKLTALRDEISSWVASGDVVGNELLLIKNGKIIFHESFGWSDLGSGKSVERNSIWNIRSMTKPLTATAMMMLVEDGLLSLDDKVIDHIPEFKGYRETTIGHLLSHTSGYSRKDFSDYDETMITLEDWVMSGITKQPTGTFGEHEYTDLGFVVSGYIIEKVTGQPLADFITENIIQPLGLKNTRVNFSDDPEWRSRISTWYEVDQETGEYILNWPSDREAWRIFGGAWGMFSTVLDYAEILACFENKGHWNAHQLLSPESVELMTRPHGYLNDIAMYGYGWMLQSSRSSEEIILNYGHRGGDALAGYVFPQDSMIMVYMSHSRGGRHREALMEKLNDLGLIRFTKYLGAPIRPERFEGAILKPTGGELRLFCGQYKEEGEGDDLCEIIHQGSHLTLTLCPAGNAAKTTIDLAYLGDHKFAIADYLDGELDWLNPEGIVEFSEQDGQIRGFELRYRDRSIIKAVREFKEE